MIRVWQPKSVFSLKPSPVTKKRIIGALSLWALSLAPLTTFAEPEQSFIEMLNAVQQALAGNGIGADGGDGPGDGSGDGGGPAA